MSKEYIEFLTPVGRIVSGDPWKGRSKDAKGNIRLIKNGPNAGEPLVEYYVALAISKSKFSTEINEMFAQLSKAAKNGYPALFDAQGNFVGPADFSWKCTDGNSQIANKRGNKPCDKDGWPGHWVFHFSAFGDGPTIVDAAYKPITDRSGLKRGDYVRIWGNTTDNSPSESPGVYLNMDTIRLITPGAIIQGGTDGVEAMRAVASPDVLPDDVVPPEASATTEGPGTQAAGGPPMGNPQSATVGAGTASGAPVASGPGGTVTQAQGFAGGPPPGPPTSEPKYQTSTGVYTKAELLASGWNEAQILACPVV